MAISGLILWWPKKGNLRRAITFKFSSAGKKFHRDLHSSIGFWTAILLLITSFSGIYLAFPQGTGNFITAIFSGQNFVAANKIKVSATKTQSLKIDNRKSVV